MKKRILLVGITILVAFCLSFSAYADRSYSYSISVTPVVQSNSNWCWAACAEMAGKVLYPSTGRTQSDAYCYIYHSLTGNASASIEDSANATEYVTHFNSTLTGVYYTLSFSTIKTHIQNGNPIQAAAGYYIGSTRCGGHVVVIKGVYFASATSTKYIQYVDPANGNTYSCTYTAFCNGSYNGRKYDQTVFVN